MTCVEMRNGGSGWHYGWLVLGLLGSKTPQNDNLEDSWFLGMKRFDALAQN